MCHYWRKLHTCTHLSDRRYIDMCKPGRLSNTVCPDIADNTAPRNSHFPCWHCIRSESRADAEALARANMAAVEVKEVATKLKQAAEARVREERVRSEYREKAAREREEDTRRKDERDHEMEKAKKEGGLWIETGGGKKSKGRKGPLTPVTPLVVRPAIKTILTREKKENVAASGTGAKTSPGKTISAKMSSAKTSPAMNSPVKASPAKAGLVAGVLTKASPPKEKSIESSGRAGVWGSKRAFLRKENFGTSLKNRDGL